MAKSKGWIKLYRKSENNPLYFAEPFDKWHAWQDLLLMANHERKELISKSGKTVTVEAGQLVTSVPILARRWSWSKNKVRRFLELLGRHTNGTAMCHIDGTPNGTTITIVNWAFYQDGRHTDGATNESADGTADGTQTRRKEYKKRERKPRYTDDELFAAVIEREEREQREHEAAQTY